MTRPPGLRMEFRRRRLNNVEGVRSHDRHLRVSAVRDRFMNDHLPKAILLDLDDTILALTESVDPCWRRICKRFASRIKGITTNELFAAIKEIRIWYWGNSERHRRGRIDLIRARREIVAAALLLLGLDAPTLANEIANAYTLEQEKAIRPLPGAIEALQRFRSQGVRMALITNGSADGQWRKIQRFKLTALFDCIVVEGGFGVGKPNEQVYLHALKNLDAKPEETWMIGDNLECEVSAPQRLGIMGIWIDLSGQGLPEASRIIPDRVIRSLADLANEYTAHYFNHAGRHG